MAITKAAVTRTGDKVRAEIDGDRGVVIEDFDPLVHSVHTSDDAAAPIVLRTGRNTAIAFATREDFNALRSVLNSAILQRRS